MVPSVTVAKRPALQSDANSPPLCSTWLCLTSGTELVRHMKTEKRLMKIPVMMMTPNNPKLSSDSFAAGAVVFLPSRYHGPATTMLRMLVAGPKATEFGIG